ncbi:hypothetical protein FBU30_003427 [Linnemannia zychae]|nr:hypothetical protein FBU30_003427 [Linnemannia zychae]
MDSHANPWSYQQQQSTQEDDDVTTTNKLYHKRHSHDRRHLSYASTATLTSDSFNDSINDEPHNIFFASLPKPELTPVSATSVFDLNDHDLQQHKQHQSSHVRSWSQEGTIATASEYGGDTFEDDDKQKTNSQCHTENNCDLELADNTLNSIPILSTDTLLSLSSGPISEALTHVDLTAERAMTDSGIGIEGDMLEHLVQKLQSEVADTRAVVSDLETRLNAAEHSNKHIVEELKMLLADAEGTLVGSDDSDSGGESEIVGSKHGSGSEDETNIVYNRICNALQSLISEAQTALVRNTSAALFAPRERGSCRYQQQHTNRSKHLTLNQTPNGQLVSSLFTDNSDMLSGNIGVGQGDLCSHSSCRTSRRSSISISRAERSPLHFHATSTSSSVSVTSSSSRMSGRSSRKSAYARMIWKEKQLQQYERYRRSCDRVSLELEMLLSDSMMDAEYEDDYNPLAALFPLLTESPFTTSNNNVNTTTPSTISILTTPDVSVADDKSQSGREQTEAIRAGPRSAKLQRSLEFGLILWVILKLGEVVLSFMGIPLLKGGPQSWLMYIYGDQAGPGSTVAKGLYEKIKRDGLKLRQAHLRRVKESEQILQDFASEAAAGLVGTGLGGLSGGKIPFSAAGMVWGPLQRTITHAVAGIVLAFLADHGKRLSKKL